MIEADDCASSLEGLESTHEFLNRLANERFESSDTQAGEERI